MKTDPIKLAKECWASVNSKPGQYSFTGGEIIFSCEADLQQFVQSVIPQWQPIETAPKDGTEILGWNADRESQEPVSWNNRDYWCSTLYYLLNDGDSVYGYDLNITHWMPLQTGPQATK